MALDLKSLFGLHVQCAQLYSLAETTQRNPRPPPPPPFGLIYEGAIGQPRQTTSLCDPLREAVSRRLEIYYTVYSTLSPQHFPPSASIC
jgi:hypothetical protein